MNTSDSPEFTNHLIHSTSPYLLQHAHNPVDWYPWGPEALQRAKDEDKPIFLSIGYAACHWCHVMEHESFENPEVAQILNRHFISIKVDREERPDLDEIYMTATQMVTGSGGWPMSVFLTPELHPFYAGTYFPPEDKWGRPGFKRLIETLAEAFHTRRDEVERSAYNIKSSIELHLVGDHSANGIPDGLVEETIESLRQRFDPMYGGFGGAPKFPHTMDLMLLFRHFNRTGKTESLQMAVFSLEKMASGGMYDQLGGGFHRYSVDEQWLIPHFEKMLYDNALLARTYLEGYQVTGQYLFKKVVTETLDYILREMQSEEGGYYSSTDADSEGEEGKFFVWSPQEITALLGEEDARIFCEYYSIRPGGNFERTGKSVLSVPKPLATVAHLCGKTEDEVLNVLDRAKPLLLAERSKRVPPALDDKILTDWNGLMISAMALSGYVLKEDKYLHSARQAAKAILLHQWNGEKLLHTRRCGVSQIEGMLADYAALSMGLIDLFRATGETVWLEKAIAIHSAMTEKFSNPSSGGFYNTIADQEDLIFRTTTASDGATPSGSSLAVWNAVHLAAITGQQNYLDQARRALESVANAIERMVAGFPMMLLALDAFEQQLETLVVVPAEQTDPFDFLDGLRERYTPYLVSIPFVDPDLPRYSSLVQGKKSLEGKSTAYLCCNQTCLPPVTNPTEVLRQLR